MLRVLDHGQRITSSNPAHKIAPEAATTETAPADCVLDAHASPLAAAKAAAPSGGFGYMFDGPGLPEDPDAFAHLGELGAAMIDGATAALGNLPAILTFFGQFIDHDVTANTDREENNPPAFLIGGPALVRNERTEVTRSIGNLRIGSLRLDSVYGDDGEDAPIGSMQEEALLRDGSNMRIGTEGDLPRYGSLVDAGLLTEAQLPDVIAMRPHFPNIDPRQFAFIGDSRNDENLIIAQLHLAFLKLHNAFAAQATGSEEDRFRAARAQVRRHYQWLVVHGFLSQICDAATLKEVIASDAKRYRAFAARAGDVFALPLEFSIAAFRFGHSMIRPSYLLNPVVGAATLADLFQFTGRGGLGGAPVLPPKMRIDWRGFLTPTGSGGTMRIDTQLAAQLHDLPNENPAPLRVLPMRNLRRSYVFNLPTAQSVIAQLRAERVAIDLLPPEVLRAATAGDVLDRLGYLEATPLWFYILAEAGDAAARGSRSLGRLGSLIVAETLIGLLVNDPESVWNTPGSGGDDRWHPRDAGLARDPIDSFEKLLVFAGVHPA